jgi:hypothetical protein
MDMWIDGLLTVFFCLSVFGASYFVPSWFGAYDEESDILCACFQLVGIAAGTEFPRQWSRNQR